MSSFENFDQARLAQPYSSSDQASVSPRVRWPSGPRGGGAGGAWNPSARSSGGIGSRNWTSFGTGCGVEQDEAVKSGIEIVRNRISSTRRMAHPFFQDGDLGQHHRLEMHVRQHEIGLGRDVGELIDARLLVVAHEPFGGGGAHQRQVAIGAPAQRVIDGQQQHAAERHPQQNAGDKSARIGSQPCADSGPRAGKHGQHRPSKPQTDQIRGT